MQEVWKDVVDDKFHGIVEVSNYGRARRKETGEICNLYDNGAGYLAVGYYVYGKQTMRYIHRLVAQVFHDNPENLPQVGHRDDDKSNNHPDNLYWCSGSRNIRDAHKTGRMKKRSEHGSTKRYPEKVVADAYRSVVLYGNGLSETAKIAGMPRTTLSSIVNKRSWSKVTDEIDKERS